MLFAICVIILLILFPSEAKSGATIGLRLCSSAVIPSLFPFFVATRLLAAKLPNISANKKLLGLNSNILPAFLVSFIGGYPVGVASVVSLYENGRITKHEAERAILFCNNSGPGFFVGMVGATVLGNVRSGLILYAIHILGAIFCALLLSEKDCKSAKITRLPQEKHRFAQSFSDAISASCASILQVCSLVVFFSVLTSLLQRIGLFSFCSSSLQALICGAIELTSGISMLGRENYAFIFSAFLMGWGGLCVHMQAICIWQKAKLKPKGYFTAKLIHGLISALLAVSFQFGGTFFVSCTLILSFICVIFQYFMKFGVAKRQNLLYNDQQR